MADDPLIIGDTTFTSRLIMGTGGAPVWRSWSRRCGSPAPN